MIEKDLENKFCKIALDSLKSYRHKEFTVKFLKRHNLPKHRTLSKMWGEIQKWLDQGDYSRCLDLLEYVDDLKMWGRQRIFLYEIVGKKEELTNKLSTPDFVRELVGDVYEQPVYRWEADKPFLAEVKHKTDAYTGARLLVFKMVEMRKFDQLIDDNFEQHEERSTNFFIVNLDSGFAELRLQQLPVRAHRRIDEERSLFEEIIKKYLKFKPLLLEPVMSEMIRRPIYTITSTEFIANEDAIPGVGTLVTVINNMFSHPIPSHVAAYWECKQAVLGESRLHFRLYGSNDSIAFGGVADPHRISDILQKIIDIHLGINDGVIDGIGKKKSIWEIGFVDDIYKSLEGQPRAQAVVLSAGSIAALLIWIVIEGVGNYLLEEWVESILGGFPLIAITLVIELVWTVFFYGWDRVKRSFGALRSIPLSQIWSAFKKAKSGDIVRHGENWRDREDETENSSASETETESPY